MNLNIRLRLEDKKKAQYLALDKVRDDIEMAVETSENGYQTLLDDPAERDDGEEDTDTVIDAVELDMKNQTMTIQYTMEEEEAALEEICSPRTSQSSLAAYSSLTSSTSTPPSWRRKLGTGNWFTKKVLTISYNALDFEYWIKEQETFWSNKFEGTIPATREVRWQFADSIIDNDWVHLIRSRARNMDTWQDVLALMQQIMHQRDPPIKRWRRFLQAKQIGGVDKKSGRDGTCM